ncbi:alkaline phosphatase [Actinomadura xylanilytica]|uniref:alkaline phosphatase n=1 Tax=Actinomadura xylanilytica TaxID=887459 RepID=UPI00255AC54E|nr:alkaline phosphatase [Actinomadura xylanilytica]MDL4773678.1 alkaline phosphatase [Actinomadura xylanilytica]
MSTAGRTRRVAAITLAAGVAAGALGTGIAGASNGDRTKDVRAAVKGGTARNVILLIGDGMGDSEITAARNYAKGAAGRLNMDRLPLTGAYTTYALQKDDPKLPDYVTDSAASGTGWATGHKSYNGAISVTPDGKPKSTILELAKRAGFRTGDVTTAELTDATPGVLAAHVVDRSCQGPGDMKACPSNDKANGGAGSIAEQQVQTGADLYFGGGKARFAQTVKSGRFKGKTVIDQARAAGYNVVTDAAGLNAARPSGKTLGLFADGTMQQELTGPAAKVGGTAPSKCTPNDAFSGPHLTQMASKAISTLDAQTKRAKRGFFLQIEGASIDKRDHDADPCGQIGETIEFDNTVKLAQDYARKHPDTLVVTTADHGHTSQIIPLEAESPGQTATLITADGAQMKMNYATNPAGASQEHTGTQVRIAASGPQAANVVGVTDQTGLFSTVTRALGVRR